MKSNYNISLKKVTKLDYDFLFELLKQRDSTVNISHKSMPTFNQHKKFVLSNPYKKWYVVKFNEEKIGSLYLSYQNEIGIFLIKKFNKFEIFHIVIQTLQQKNPQIEYFANVNPKNKRLKRFFQRDGFKLIQHTYKLTKNE